MRKKYWFNTQSKKVEYGKQSLGLYLIGPFETEEEAKNAIEILKERSKQWQQEDEQENS